MKLQTDLFDGKDANLAGQLRVSAAQHGVGVHRALRLNGGNLAVGVHSRIGAARTRHMHIMIEEFTERALQFALNGLELRLAQVMRDVLVVPETKSVLDLIRDFQQRRRHMAIVVDEYGSTVGLVTAEDAIEQLTGELEDEF